MSETVYDDELEFFYEESTKELVSKCPNCDTPIKVTVNFQSERWLALCPKCFKIFLVSKVFTKAIRSPEDKNLLIAICPYCYTAITSKINPNGSFLAKVVCSKYHKEYWLTVENEYGYKTARLHVFICEIKPWCSEKIEEFLFMIPELDGDFHKLPNGCVFLYSPKTIGTAAGDQIVQMVIRISNEHERMRIEIYGKYREVEAQPLAEKFIEITVPFVKAAIIPRTYEGYEWRGNEWRMFRRLNINEGLAVDDKGREIQSIAVIPKQPKKEYIN